MRVVGIVGCAIAIGWAAGCGPGDPPEAIRYTGTSTGSGSGGANNGVPPPVGGPGGFAGSGGSAGPPGGSKVDAAVGVYSESVVEADPAPPPIAGGTLAIIAHGAQAAVADPDHDQVVVIDLPELKIAAVIPLALGDDPGRLVEDAAGRLHVALRAGRGVAVLDPKAGVTLGRLPVCALPRGLAYDFDTDSVHVACAGGELVSYTASSGQLVRRLRLERDLRDVVIDGERLLVSRFRSAELLVVEGDGTVSDKLVPQPGMVQGGTSPMRAAVAWRTVAAPGGGAMMVHQLMDPSPINTDRGGYGGQCRKIMSAAVSLLRLTRDGWMVDAIPTVLPVDVASTADGQRMAVPSAAWTPLSDFGGTVPFAVFDAPRLGVHVALAPCGASIAIPTLPGGTPAPLGRITAVAFDPAGRLALQTRAPAVFHLGAYSIALPGRARKHTGHELFHLATTGGLACASCHPEGREDGQVWNFARFGLRRTQSLSGGIAGTEPFHWSGDMSGFETLTNDVFNSRMSGPHIESAHVLSLFNWINQIPALPAPEASDAGAVAHGKSIFNDPAVGCATCHAGPRMTNNATMSVNTGDAFQVPSLLGVAWRAPYMHNGCAPTLAARFGSCGGGDAHGQTSQLTAADQADLIAYLETL